MGVGGIGIWQLLIILVIVLLLFGTKRLKSIGSDLGGAIKGFRGAMRDAESKDDENDEAKELEDSSVAKRDGKEQKPAEPAKDQRKV